MDQPTGLPMLVRPRPSRQGRPEEHRAPGLAAQLSQRCYRDPYSTTAPKLQSPSALRPLFQNYVENFVAWSTNLDCTLVGSETRPARAHEVPAFDQPTEYISTFVIGN